MLIKKHCFFLNNIIKNLIFIPKFVDETQRINATLSTLRKCYPTIIHSIEEISFVINSNWLCNYGKS